MSALVEKIRWFIKKVRVHEQSKPLFTYPMFLLRVWICRRRYSVSLKRLVEKRKNGEKIRVLFLNSSSAKWKCQSLYDVMKSGTVFEPMIGLTFCDDELDLSDETLSRRISDDMAFFEHKGCACIMACDVKSRTVRAPSEFEADIVFMAVPWGVLKPQTVFDISRYALPCYMPYGLDYVELKGKLLRFNWVRLADFHLLLWRYFSWSKAGAECWRAPHFNFERAGDGVGLGHTSLDALLKCVDCTDDGVVIYAPHFSFVWNDMRPIDLLSTFDWSGKPILAYAKAHPEIKWAFKPHPLLRRRMVQNGFMTEDEARQYYEDWGRIAETCYDGGYSDLFARSRAMITDCCSFLMEYAATGKPLIRLVPKETNVLFTAPAQKIIFSHYACHDLDEMNAALKLVVEDRQDPRREERQAAAREAGLFGNNVAERIVKYLSEALS